MAKAFTSPTSASVGDDITATLLNSYKTAVDNTAAREGARARTNVAQTIPINTITALTNNGTAAWTSVEDSGSFVSATGGTTTPISIPAGKGGLYIVGATLIFSALVTSRGLADILVNGTGSKYRAISTGDDHCVVTSVIALNAADTLGVQVFVNPSVQASVGIDLFCYRLGL